LEACHAVVQAAYELWLQYEIRTDDITIICIYVDGTGDGQQNNKEEEGSAPQPDGVEVSEQKRCLVTLLFVFSTMGSQSF